MTSFKQFNSLVLVSLLLFICYSCGEDAQDEGNDGELPKTGFTINSDVYETPNAYLIFNSVLQYDSETMMDVNKIKNQFSFLFLDGNAISNDGNILYSTDTKQSSYNHFRDLGGMDILDDIQEVTIAPNTYSHSPSSTTRVNISNVPEDLVDNGVSFGNPSLLGTNYVLINEDVATFKINSLDINYDSMMGTIDCEYSISPSWEGPIMGRYNGSFRILIR